MNMGMWERLRVGDTVVYREAAVSATSRLLTVSQVCPDHKRKNRAVAFVDDRGTSVVTELGSSLLKDQFARMSLEDIVDIERRPDMIRRYIAAYSTGPR